MDVERDLREPASARTFSREGRAAERRGEEHGFALDLMGELRALAEDPRTGASGPPRAPYEAVEATEPTAQVPLALLRRVAAALVEARLALTRSHGIPEVGRPDAAWADVRGTELDAARMVALNMALNGAPRAETERYLRRNFALQDPAQVAADAYRRRHEGASA